MTTSAGDHLSGLLATLLLAASFFLLLGSSVGLSGGGSANAAGLGKGVLEEVDVVPVIHAVVWRRLPSTKVPAVEEDGNGHGVFRMSPRMSPQGRS